MKLLLKFYNLQGNAVAQIVRLNYLQ